MQSVFIFVTFVFSHLLQIFPDFFLHVHSQLLFYSQIKIFFPQKSYREFVTVIAIY